MNLKTPTGTTPPLTHILKVEKDGPDGLLVTFSDGTIAGFVVEELLHLRPHREIVESDHHTTIVTKVNFPVGVLSS